MYNIATGQSRIVNILSELVILKSSPNFFISSSLLTIYSKIADMIEPINRYPSIKYMINCNGHKSF